MIQPLLNHIGKYCCLPEGSDGLIALFFGHRTYQKKTLLLSEGQNCFEKFFIVKGCVQLSYLRQNGTEQIIDFALENWWTSDFMAFQHGGASAFSIRATEPTDVLCLSADHQRELLKQVPELNAYFHLVSSGVTPHRKCGYGIYTNFLKWNCTSISGAFSEIHPARAAIPVGFFFRLYPRIPQRIKKEIYFLNQFKQSRQGFSIFV